MQETGLAAALPAAGEATRRPRRFALDATNARILDLLCRDGRTTIKALAEAVGRSESTVRGRVAAMERRGVLLGYAARVDWGTVGLQILVLFEGDCSLGRAEEVAHGLEGIPHVVQALVTTGTPNVIALVRARDLEEVNGVRLRLAATGLINVHARIMLEPLVHERSPVQPEAVARASRTPARATATRGGHFPLAL